MIRRVALLIGILAWMNQAMALAAGPHMLQPRVPADQLEKARSLHSPLPESADVVTLGKELYEGKGSCVNCHGITGAGNGPGSVNLNPPPRNFRHHGFWRHRSEGEIFWVIKNGSPGTAMIPFGGLLSNQEIWTIIQYERRFAGGRGSRGGNSKDHGPRGGMGQGPGDHQGGHQSCCGEP